MHDGANPRCPAEVQRDVSVTLAGSRRRGAVAIVLAAMLFVASLLEAQPAWERDSGRTAGAAVSDGGIVGGSAEAVGSQVLGQPPVASRSIPRIPRIAARAAIVENLATGEVLMARSPDARMPVASLTKVMTAMLVQASTGPNEQVRISRKAAVQEPTNVQLHAGWRLRAGPLIDALMIHSANDAAVALAEHVAGSVSAFDRSMNSQAAALGMAATHFMSPSGLNDQGLSSARDVATMTRWALASTAFASLVRVRRYTMRLPNGKRLKMTNLNDLLFTYPGAIGVKTGYTKVAGWSVAAAARRGRLSVLAVVLGDPREPFAAGRRLLDYGFAVLRSAGQGPARRTSVASYRR